VNYFPRLASHCNPSDLCLLKNGTHLLLLFGLQFWGLNLGFFVHARQVVYIQPQSLFAFFYVEVALGITICIFNFPTILREQHCSTSHSVETWLLNGLLPTLLLRVGVSLHTYNPMF
jgi:hypothetical protein